MKKKKRKVRVKDSTGRFHVLDSHLEHQFFQYWDNNYPTYLFCTQYVFSTEKAYAFDFAWPNKKVALEIQGYGPGHNSPQGARRDAEKHNLALRLHWRVVYLVSHHLKEENIHLSCTVLRRLLGISDADYQRGPRAYVPAALRKRR